MKKVIWQAIGKSPVSFTLTLETDKEERVEQIAKQLEKCFGGFGGIEETIGAKIVIVKGWAEN